MQQNGNRLRRKDSLCNLQQIAQYLALRPRYTANCVQPLTRTDKLMHQWLKLVLNGMLSSPTKQSKFDLRRAALQTTESGSFAEVAVAAAAELGVFASAYGSGIGHDL